MNTPNMQGTASSRTTTDIPVILVDSLEHTDEHPFCLVDPTCPCHEDLDLIAPLAQAVADGLMTPKEASDYIMGRTLQGGWL